MSMNYKITATLILDAHAIADTLENELADYLSPVEPLHAKIPLHRGMGMVGDSIGWVIREHAKWNGPARKPDTLHEHNALTGLWRAPPTTRRAILPGTTPLRSYFLPHLRNPCILPDGTLSRVPMVLDGEDTEEFDNILTRASGLLMNTRQAVSDFLGDDHWVIHFYGRLDAQSYIVEKTIDYRIADWERRMKTGEWS